MELYASPAVLGGIVACFAMSAWAVARLPSATRSLAEARGPEPLPQHPPFEWRAAVRVSQQTGHKAEPDCGPSLSELHAEVSAYRRQQQVLASIARDGLRIDQITATAPSVYGEAQGIDRLLRPVSEAALGPRSPAPRKTERADQPSPAASVLTRV